jgi:hypothetical protein
MARPVPPRSRAVVKKGSKTCAALAGDWGSTGYFYVLLQLEDWALLLDTVGLFVILATVMYVTRNLDWYAVDLGGGRLGPRRGRELLGTPRRRRRPTAVASACR